MSQLTLVIGNKNISSWSLRPWLALRKVGVPFNEIVVYLDKPDTAAQIARYSPSGRVPVLRDGELVVWDSLAILEYLAEKFPQSQLWPEDSRARAQARSMSSEMHSGFASLRQNLPFNGRARDIAPKAMDDSTRTDIDRVFALWREARQGYGKSGPFLFGGFSAADAMYAPVVSRFRTYGIDCPDDITRAYADAVWALPELQEWLRAAEDEG